MRIMSWPAACLLIASLSACGGGPAGSDDAATSPANGTIVKLDARGGSVGSPVAGEARYDVMDVEITVPMTLAVSEANLFYPKADIVWRGEPVGDRYAQVKAVLDEGITAGVANMNSGPKVVLAVTLERFHALTEKARFSVGGVHDIVLSIVVRDAATGSVLEGPRRIEVAIRASGGDQAIAEDAAGNTQRAVIVAGLAEAMKRDLAVVPVGIEPKRKGLLQGLSLKRGTQ